MKKMLKNTPRQHIHPYPHMTAYKPNKSTNNGSVKTVMDVHIVITIMQIDSPMCLTSNTELN